MDQTEFANLVKFIFSKSESGSGEFLDAGRWHYTNDGILAIAQEDSGVVGFEIASDMVPTFELVEKVAELNRRMTWGHYWLSRGADDEHWLLVCGFKFVYETLTPEYVIDVVAPIVGSRSALVTVVCDFLDGFPLRRNSTSGDPAVNVLALLGHLA